MTSHPNPDQAQPEDIECWKQQAEAGDVEAQFSYAFVHYRGERTTMDYSLARKWFAVAVQQGHTKSAFYLGVMLEHGWGGETDLSGAATHYLKAAKANFMPAQHNLGRLFQEGRGVLKNLAEAHFWLSVAASNGGEHSQEGIDKFIGQMSNSEIDSVRRKVSEWSQGRLNITRSH